MLDNKLATDSSHHVTTTNSSVSLGKATLDLAIDGKSLGLKFTPGQPEAGNLVIVGVSGTNPSKSVTLIVPFDIASDTAPKSIMGGITLLATYLETGKVSLGQIPADCKLGRDGVGLGEHRRRGDRVQPAGKSPARSMRPCRLINSTFNTQVPASVHLTGSFTFQP